MNIIFMGSAPLSCASYDAIMQEGKDAVVAVVTQPDRPKGRHRRVSPCAVRAHLSNQSMPIITPESVNAPDVVEELRKFKPDLLVVVAFGQILKKPLLELAPLGCINVHASLLPKYRGAAPIPWAIACGETQTGITTMYMNERLDAGDIILQKEIPIDPGDTAKSLHDRLAVVGGRSLLETIDLIREGKAPRRIQDESASTMAPKLSHEHGRIQWAMSAHDLHNRVRAFIPWPMCYCELIRGTGDMVRLLKTEVVSGMNGKPGQILRADTELIVATGQHALWIKELQPAGKTGMTASAYLCGHPLPEGAMAG